MIVPEWKRVLEGKEPFEDPDAEVLAKEIMRRMELSSNAAEIIELANDLERVMAEGEWMARKEKRLVREKAVGKIFMEGITDADVLNKLNRVREKRNEVVLKLRSKYGLL
ncbi:hypothetical protein [Geoglobus ahangari]